MKKLLLVKKMLLLSSPALVNRTMLLNSPALVNVTALAKRPALLNRTLRLNSPALVNVTALAKRPALVNRTLRLLFFQAAACLVLLPLQVHAQHVQIATLQYRGGGDWYANPTALPNLAAFANEQTGTTISQQIATVEVGSAQLFNYPYVYMTGHGNIVFSAQEAENLRSYLMGGGFLHVDDNYGLDPYFRREIRKVFPEYELIELPFSHPIYDQRFQFPNGLPKVHEHDGKPPQGFGIIHEGRLVLFYSYEADLGNGWEDQAVHANPEEVRLLALQMGANILQYVFTKP